MARAIELDQDLVQGTTWDLVLRAFNPDPPDGDGQPRSAVGLFVKLQVRAEAYDGAPLLAEASTAAGTITTDADGWIRIRLSRAVTAAMPFNGKPRTWFYEVRVAEPGDAEPARVWVWGRVHARPRIAT